MKVTNLEIDGVKLIEPEIFNDFRGYYMESYSSRTLSLYGINDVFIQDNHFMSLKKGTIRGIHFQNDPYAQSKLLRCTKGKILDVIVDLRKSSLTYKKWISVILDEDLKRQIYIPKGLGHGCISLVDDVEVQYKVDNLYAPSSERIIAWNDPELNIEWMINHKDIIVSEKDKNAPFLKDIDFNFE